MHKNVSVATVEKRLKKTVVLADDQMQKRVLINQQILIKAERLVRQSGMPEEALTPSMHHAVVGMTAYLMVNSIDPKSPKEIRQFLTRYKSIFRKMRFEAPGEEEGQGEDRTI